MSRSSRERSPAAPGPRRAPRDGSRPPSARTPQPPARAPPASRRASFGPRGETTPALEWRELPSPRLHHLALQSAHRRQPPLVVLLAALHERLDLWGRQNEEAP